MNIYDATALTITPNEELDADEGVEIGIAATLLNTTKTLLSGGGFFAKFNMLLTNKFPNNGSQSITTLRVKKNNLSFIDFKITTQKSTDTITRVPTMLITYYTENGTAIEKIERNTFFKEMFVFLNI